MVWSCLPRVCEEPTPPMTPSSTRSRGAGGRSARRVTATTVIALMVSSVAPAAAEYIAPPGGYPSGPVVCADDEGCVPLITSWSDWPVVLSIALWACILLSALVVAAGNCLCTPPPVTDGGGGDGARPRSARKLSLQSKYQRTAERLLVRVQCFLTPTLCCCCGAQYALAPARCLPSVWTLR